MRVLFFEDGKSKPMWQIEVENVGELADRLQAILQPAKPAYDPREVAFTNDGELTIQAIADRTRRGVRRLQMRAKRERWPRRNIGRNAWVYRVESLPADIKSALANG